MGKPQAGIAWRPHQVGQTVYELDHLHPHHREHVIAARGDNPERRFLLNVSYGLHCFTRRPLPGEAIPQEGWYSDSRERRVFCPERWELSQQLPGIIETLGQRRCLHTGREEFVTLKMIQWGREIDYAVFFTVSKARKSQADLNLFVNSAHERYNRLKHTKPIKFDVILVNRFRNRPITPPR